MRGNLYHLPAARQEETQQLANQTVTKLLARQCRHTVSQISDQGGDARDSNRSVHLLRRLPRASPLSVSLVPLSWPADVVTILEAGHRGPWSMMWSAQASAAVNIHPFWLHLASGRHRPRSECRYATS